MGAKFSSKYIDKKYLGFTSGNLTVVDMYYSSEGPRFVCECKCNGNIKEYEPRKIVNGHTQSCGCNRINNTDKYSDVKYLNNIFGDLEVIDTDCGRGPNGVKWKCRCIHCKEVSIRESKYVVYGRTCKCSNITCLRDRGANKSKYDNEKYIGKQYGILEVIGIEYGNIYNRTCTQVLWECRCLACGNISKFAASDVVRGNNSSCGCIISLHEQMLVEIFKRRGIKYNQQVKFDNLTGINGGKLRFDFAIIDSKGNKKLIEYDGYQHMLNPDTSNTNWDIYLLQEHDKLKNEFCKINNIELVRISGRFINSNSLEKYLIDNNII